MMRQIVQMEKNMVKNPNRKSEQVGYFTNVVEDLNSGLPRTNPASGHRGTGTRTLRITSTRDRPRCLLVRCLIATILKSSLTIEISISSNTSTLNV